MLAPGLNINCYIWLIFFNFITSDKKYSISADSQMKAKACTAIKWTMSLQKVPSDICGKANPKSACAFVQSDQSFCFLLSESLKLYIISALTEGIDETVIDPEKGLFFSINNYWYIFLIASQKHMLWVLIRSAYFTMKIYAVGYSLEVPQRLPAPPLSYVEPCICMSMIIWICALKTSSHLMWFWSFCCKAST